MNKQSKLYTIIFTFVISFFFVFILAFANEFTKDRIAMNNELFEIKAVLYAFGIEYKDNNDAYEKYDREVKIIEINDQKIFFSEVNGENIYAMIFTGNALWGPATGVLALKEDFTRIHGLDFISHNETPGLGGRIEEKWFKEQFKNLKLNNGNIKVVITPREGDTNKDNSLVDSITGATNTSLSIETIVNQSVEKLSSLVEAIKYAE
jgi:Na+-transporting NADH:ubiquinone oxidoreductase subunit C